ncbi:hypothetical protein LB523_12015 [Mesorhizobium sp. ESP-6-4]|uniref:hypothetical protein n=1 Tax=Mesorhizobium sp. ESP-6-4 TaxID=2876624 RepID=UPI001CCDAF22|nr:hypothetical protein [Mesorhizobium sp. ESP-6-4]MBZ9659771.1 hypothetical protein [Mesorhizobium sp. ESP-6-4]
MRSIIVLMTACIGWQSSALASERYALTEMQTAAIEQTISSTLKDPSSALFGDIDAANVGGGQVLVCGSVNAKNGFGGYAGTIPFQGHIWPPDRSFYIDALASDESDALRVASQCKAILNR